MEWAKKDPVSEKEIKRNNAVYQIQKNRNPFIDYPGLEDYIWGEKKEVLFSYDNGVTKIKNILTNSVQEDKQNSKTYGTDGRVRKLNQPGVNIIKQKNGRTRKVVKK